MFSEPWQHTEAMAAIQDQTLPLGTLVDALAHCKRMGVESMDGVVGFLLVMEYAGTLCITVDGEG